MYNKYLFSQNNIRTVYAANDNTDVENKTIHFLVYIVLLNGCMYANLFIYFLIRKVKLKNFCC